MAADQSKMLGINTQLHFHFNFSMSGLNAKLARVKTPSTPRTYGSVLLCFCYPTFSTKANEDMGNDKKML